MIARSPFKLAFKLVCAILSVGLIVFGVPGVAAAQARSLTVTPQGGPAGSEVVVVGSDWDPAYYANGVEVGFYQNHGNGVLTSYADPIRIPPDKNGSFSFNTTIPTFFQPDDIVTFSALIGNGGGERANFTVTAGAGDGANSAVVDVGKAYVANSEWAESTRFVPGDVVRYQVVIKASAGATINVKMQTVGPGGRRIFDSVGDVQVAPDTGSVFNESTIPTDAADGTYEQKATVTYNGVLTERTSTFFVSSAPATPEWLTNLTGNDFVNCTVTLTSLATGIIKAPPSAIATLDKALEVVSGVTDAEVFLRTFYDSLTRDEYWVALFKAAGNVFYEQFRQCFMGMQSALQITAGEAGRFVGQWLREVVARRP